jgi:hypothetical protein
MIRQGPWSIHDRLDIKYLNPALAVACRDAEDMDSYRCSSNAPLLVQGMCHMHVHSPRYLKRGTLSTSNWTADDLLSRED